MSSGDRRAAHFHRRNTFLTVAALVCDFPSRPRESAPHWVGVFENALHRLQEVCMFHTPCTCGTCGTKLCLLKAHTFAVEPFLISFDRACSMVMVHAAEPLPARSPARRRCWPGKATAAANHSTTPPPNRSVTPVLTSSAPRPVEAVGWGRSCRGCCCQISSCWGTDRKG